MLVEYALRLMNISLAIILGYTLVMMAWGLWMSRQVKGSSDFFVAGRSLGPGLIAGTFLAANIGAGSTVGAAGLGYRDGLAAWWWVGSAAVGSFFLAMWVGPRIRALAAKHDLRTVGDFLEFRYDRRVRAAVSALLWVGSLAILSGQLIALAWILNIVAGLPKWLGCLTGGTVVTAYFASGGLLTSVKMNVLQLAVKFFGFALALPLALAAVGGFEGLRTMPVPSPGYWHWWQNGSSGWMYLAMLAPAFIISPGLLQKVYGARDDRAVRVGVGVNAFVLLLYAVVPVLIGIAARAQFPDLASHEMALPKLLADGLPPLVGAIGLAAVFSAEVSTADAVLFMLTTSLSQDLYKRFLNPSADDRRVLLVSRVTAIVGAALGTALAIVSPSVIGALSIFYTLLSVSLFVPVAAGLFIASARTRDALTSMAVGVGAVLVVQFTTGGKGVAGMTPSLVGLIAAFAGFSISYLARGGASSAEPATN